MHVIYSDEEKRTAVTTDIVSLLERCGQQVKRAGSEYVWLDNGQTVSIKDNLWFHHYDQVGGNTISFVKRFFGMDYPEALGFILGSGAGTIVNSTMKEEASKDLVIPEKNDTMNRVYAYLIKTRGIDRDIVHAFAHADLIYESKDKHNAVFLGKEPDGNIRHIHQRSTLPDSKWKNNSSGSDNRYTFSWIGRSDRLFLFEAPIDMMSYICLNKEAWQDDTYVAACSVSDLSLMQRLKEHPNIKTVYLCLDNDKAGQEATDRIKTKLETEGYKTEVLIPNLKDWNEDLLNSGQEEGESACPKASQGLSL